MCLILFAYNSHPCYRLVLAANRDEFLDRPTAPLGYNFPGEKILGGKDIRGGGSWLALDEKGRFGVITNYRDPALQVVAPPSRGEIVLDYLRAGQSPSGFLRGFGRTSSLYNPFNLLLGDCDELCYFSSVTGESRSLGPGFYGLSNHLLDTDWPKVNRGKILLEKSLAEHAQPDKERLFTALQSDERPADDQLPDTGVGLYWERLLGSIFIHGEKYGTRSSSLLMVDNKNSVELIEKSYQHDSAGWHVSGEVRHLVAAAGLQRCLTS